MKVLLRLGILGCLLGWGLVMDGQLNLATQFNLYESDDAVHLTWVIEEGNICEGIEIERSEDGINFVDVGRIEGVCGSFTGATRFDYVDAMPVLNHVNHYRLRSQHELISTVIAIEVVALGSGQCLVRPNPMAGAGVVYFENPMREVHTLSVVDLRGAVVQVLETRLERFDLDVSLLLGGIYAFVILDGDGAVAGKGRLVVGR
jgi:hypothetical protein